MITLTSVSTYLLQAHAGLERWTSARNMDQSGGVNLRKIRQFFLVLSTIYCVQLQAFVEVDSFAVSENAGTIGADVTLKTTNPTPPASIAAVRVDYTTVDGTAEDENGSGDYEAAAGTFQFTQFNVAQTVNVKITNDLIVEVPESFSLEATIISAPVTQQQVGAKNGTQAVAAGNVAINDDDLEFTVNLSFSGGAPVEVDIKLTCNNGNVNAPPLGSLMATKTTTGGVAKFKVINFLPGLQCTATQSAATPPPGFAAAGTTCNPGLAAGVKVCTINYQAVAANNAVPIPTLGLFSKLLLVLLMLGMAIGLRRYV